MRYFARASWLLMAGLALCCGMTAQAQSTVTTTKVTVDVAPVVDVIGQGKIDWSKTELRARGLGFAPSFAKTPSQIKALARIAAITDAERNLLKVINGVEVTADTTVENLIVAQDTVKTRVSGLLQGAVIVSEKPGDDNSYEVVMAVNLYGDQSSLSRSIDLASQFKRMDPAATVLPAQEPANKPADPAPPTPPAATDPQPPPPATAPLPEDYTGLVVDCRGLELARSLCPRILDQANTNLWGTLTVSTELVNERGIAAYTTALTDPALAERVGKHPLIVKALRVSGGKSVKTDAVLSPADTEFVRAENAKTRFLDKLNVAFLVDK